MLREKQREKYTGCTNFYQVDGKQFLATICLSL